ncbi:lipopolysaccharide biosynthesis protein [Roseateles sp. BYS96W]|uniref:Lipopolysaccharide biosynthesis protein n=1 Tax=Pelomonas nitida TaxID=3299027 RepID=A0ABW7G4P5_9BURK
MSSRTAVLAGWLARLVVVACGLLNTRLLLSIMAVPDYAAYAIVISLGPWVNLVNLGLPNTAQNEIAERRAKGEDFDVLRQNVVNAAALGALAFGVFSWPLGEALRHTVLSGYGGLSVTGIALMCFGLSLNGLGMVANQVLFALHRSFWPNVMPGVQALATTVLLLIFQASGRGGLDWAALSFALPAVLSFVLMARVAQARPSRGVDLALLLEVLRRSRSFLLLAFLAAATLSVDYIVMARMLTGPDVVEYSLAGKVFAVLLSVHAVLVATSWTGLSDAHYQGEPRLVRQRIARLLIVGMGVVLLPSAAILALKEPIFALITGRHDFTMSSTLLGAWALYLVLRVWCDTFALAHMSAGRLALLNGYIPFQAAISIGAQIFLGHRFGAIGVMLGLCASFMLTAAWILPMRFLQQTRPVPALP